MEEPEKFFTDGGRIVRRNDEAADAVLDNFGHAGDVRTDGRDAASHPFEQGLAEKLRDWMRAVAKDIVDDVRVRVVSEVSQIKAGETVEIALSVLNEGALPLRAFL